MTPNRDFYTGLIATVFFALVLFVLIPIYVKVPSFIPGFAPPPDMWPRVITVVGLVMGILAILFAIPKMRVAANESVMSIGATLQRNRKLILRFVAVLIGFAAFTYGMPLIGFVPATILLLAYLFLMTGNYSRKIWMIGLTIAFPILLYLVFTEVTHTPFPEGRLFSAIMADFVTLI
ncbi:tripartite tricarboxylate transporter TctB family protein [Thalassospira australica]|uniref:tripartite tricarboxylate transporter TctB family protein n=1 Tax=Thalassospira australica TaxID=1528106 RepID=UPI00384B9371